MEVDVRLPHTAFPYSCSFVKQDIVPILHTNRYSKAFICFPPKYSFDKAGRHQLYVDISRAALSGGDRLTLWGTGCAKKQVMHIRCQCSILYRGNKVDKETGALVLRSDIRKSTFSNDRKNQRRGQAGKNAAHRSSSSRRLTKHEDHCSFSLSIFQDESGYYMQSTNSKPFHQYHPRRDKLRILSSHLTDEQCQLQEDLNTARSKLGAAVNLHYVRSARTGTPTVLSSSQIAYLCKKKAKDGKTKDGQTDDIYKFLEESGNYYISLLARGPVDTRSTSKDPPSKDLLCSADSVSKDPTPPSTLYNESRLGKVMGREDILVDTSDDQDMLKVVSDHRRELKLDDSKEMMVGIAYAMPFELDQFGLFHVTLHIDATSDTNKEGRPLVTVTSKDSFGRMFFVLRAFLPSEQSWAYKWLFQTVFPVLIGKDVLNKVSLMVTDGDSQEISQLEDSVKKFFPNVYRIRCSWHIIDRGWHKKVKVPLGGHTGRKRPPALKGTRRKKPAPLTDVNKTARTIYRWMFSWAQPNYCETPEEYIVSKALFLKFVQSNQVKVLFGEIFVHAVIDFVRESVFPHEERFCYYLRHSLFHLETHTNCGHEGTNNGVKNCASPVMPQNNLDRSIKTLSLNAEIKAANTSILVANKTHRTKLWTDSPTSAYVSDPCESMIQSEWTHASDWIPHRVSEFRWLLVHRLDKPVITSNDWPKEDDSDTSDEEEEELDVDMQQQKDYRSKFGPIPRFLRVYEVVVDEDTRVFSCTCCNQERMGMPCRHIGSVCQANESILGVGAKGFPLSSVRVFWWNQYYMFGLSKAMDHSRTKEALIALADNDTLGVACPLNLVCPLVYSCPDQVLESFHTPATDRLLNYDSYDAIAATQLLRDRLNPVQLPDSIPAGMSQLSHLPDDDNELYPADDWLNSIEELTDDEDYRDSRRVLSRHYNELSEAFNNSRRKEALEEEFKVVMNEFTVKARGSAAIPSTSQGTRVSMLPASSRKRKTHGTKHY